MRTIKIIKKAEKNIVQIIKGKEREISRGYMGPSLDR